MGNSIGMGKFDKNATNDVLNGQTVATGTPGSRTMADPNGGLSDSNLRNRRAAKIGVGFLNGATQQGPGPQRYGMQGVNFDFANNQPGYQPMTAANRNPFFGPQ